MLDWPWCFVKMGYSFFQLFAENGYLSPVLGSHLLFHFSKCSHFFGIKLITLNQLKIPHFYHFFFCRSRNLNPLLSSSIETSGLIQESDSPHFSVQITPVLSSSTPQSKRSPPTPPKYLTKQRKEKAQPLDDSIREEEKLSSQVLHLMNPRHGQRFVKVIDCL